MLNLHTCVFLGASCEPIDGGKGNDEEDEEDNEDDDENENDQLCYSIF